MDHHGSPCHSHFTDGLSEAQRGEIILWGSLGRAGKKQEPPTKGPLDANHRVEAHFPRNSSQLMVRSVLDYRSFTDEETTHRGG